MKLLKKEFKNKFMVGSKSFLFSMKLWEVSKTIGITNKITDKGWVFFADIDNAEADKVVKACSKLQLSWLQYIGDIIIIKTRADGLHWHIIGTGIIPFKHLLVEMLESLYVNRVYIGLGYSINRWTLRMTKKDDRDFKPHIYRILTKNDNKRNSTISLTLIEFLKQKYPSLEWNKVDSHNYRFKNLEPLELVQYDTINVKKKGKYRLKDIPQNLKPHEMTPPKTIKGFIDICTDYKNGTRSKNYVHKSLKRLIEYNLSKKK